LAFHCDSLSERVVERPSPGLTRDERFHCNESDRVPKPNAHLWKSPAYQHPRPSNLYGIRAGKLPFPPNHGKHSEEDSRKDELAQACGRAPSRRAVRNASGAASTQRTGTVCSKTKPKKPRWPATPAKPAVVSRCAAPKAA
jgi:hypothetical protein